MTLKYNEIDLKKSTEYLSKEQSPKFKFPVEEYHSYYFKCPLCKKCNENVSNYTLDKLHCNQCRSEFTKDGLLLFNALTNLKYFPF